MQASIDIFSERKYREQHPDAEISRRIREDFSLYHVSDARDAFRVRLLRNPLKPETFTDAIYPYGTSIATIMLAQGMYIESPAIIYVNGEQIKVADRESFFPARNSTVTIRVVWGNEASGIQAGFMILGAAVGSLVGAPMLGAMVGSAIGGVVAGLVVGAPKQPKYSTIPNVYSISASTNLLAPYAPIPLPEGNRKASMTWYGSPYNETGRHEQFVRLLASVGYGPCDLTQYKIKNTDLTGYDNVLADIRNGYPDDAPLVLYTGIPNQINLSVTLLDTTSNNTAGTGFQQATTVPNASEIAVDFACPNGLGTTNDVGNTRWAQVTIQVRYALVGTDHTAGANWNLLPTNVQMLGLSTRQLLATKRWAVTPGQYDVQCQVSAVSFQRGGSASPGNIFFGSTVWTSLRTFIAGNAVNIPNQTQVALRILGTGQLNGDINDLTCVYKRVTRLWNATGGSSGTGSWEDKAGSWFYDYETAGNGAAYYDLDTSNPHTGGGKALRVHLAANSDGAYVASKAIPVRWPTPKYGGTLAYPGDTFDITLWYRTSRALASGIYARIIFSDTTDILQMDFPITLAIPSAGGGTPPWNVLNNQSTPDTAWHSVTVTGIGIPNHATIATNRSIHNPNHARYARLEIGATVPSGGVVDVYFDDIVSLHKDGESGTQFSSNWIPNGSFNYPGQANSNPASAYRDLLQADRGVGFTLPDSRLNLPQIQSFSEYCRINGFNFDGRLDEDNTNIQDAANRILEAGRGAIRQNDGIYGVVIDQASKTPTGMFADRNIVKGSYSWEAAFIDKPHAYRVRYADSINDFNTLEVLAYDKGYSSGGPAAQTNEVLFTGDGVATSLANASGFGIRCWPIGTSTIIGYLPIGSSLTINSITCASTTATLTTSAAHGLSTGQFVTIKGTAQYNGVYQITVTGTTTFTFVVAAAAPANGVAGNCVRTFQFTDNGAGVLSGTHITSGTVNYATGAWTLVLDTACTSGYTSVVNYTGFSGTVPATRIDTYDLSESKINIVDAWRFGMFKLTNDRLHGVIHKWDAFREHIMCQRGDVVYLQRFASNMALGSARIKTGGVALNGSADATAVTIDEKWLLAAGTTQVIRIRRSDNTFLLANISTPANDTLTSTITFQTPISHTGPLPEDLDLVTFGDPPQVLIIGIDPGENHNTRKITAVAYDPAVYTAELAAFPYATTVNQVITFPTPTLKSITIGAVTNTGLGTSDTVQAAGQEGTRVSQIIIDLLNTDALHTLLFHSNPQVRILYRLSNNDFPNSGTDRGAYDPTVTYAQDDVVTYYDGGTWESLTASNTGHDPVATEGTNWANLSGGDQPWDELIVQAQPHIVVEKYIEAKRYYDIKIRYESPTGQFGPWLVIPRTQVVGQTTLPGPLQAATATYTGTLGKVKLAWTMPKTAPPPSRKGRNIKFVEVRLDNGSGVWANGTDGAGGGAGTFVYRGKVTHFIVNDLVAGSYTWLLKSIDTHDNYAADADMLATTPLTITAAQASLDSIKDGPDYIKPALHGGGTDFTIDNRKFRQSAVLPPVGWSVAPVGGVINAGAVLSYDSTVHFSGTKSLKVVTSGGNQGFAAIKRFPVHTGDSLKLSVVLKSDGTAQCYAVIAYFRDDGTFVDQLYVNPTTSTSFTTYTIVGGCLNTPSPTIPTDAAYAVLAIQSSVAGTFWVDSINVQKVRDLDTEINEAGGLYSRSLTSTHTGHVHNLPILHTFPSGVVDSDGTRVIVANAMTYPTGASLAQFKQSANKYSGNIEFSCNVECQTNGLLFFYLPTGSSGGTNNGYLVSFLSAIGDNPTWIYRLNGGTAVNVNNLNSRSATFNAPNAAQLLAAHGFLFRYYKASGKFEVYLDGQLTFTATDRTYVINGPIGYAYFVAPGYLT